MKTVIVTILTVVLTAGATALACGGGSPVTMTVQTNATFDPAPANYVPPTESSADPEVM